MPVPTHGPHCRTLFCRPSRCGDCRQEVFYWGCSCGSRVFFDDLGEPWPTHECGRKRSILPLRTYPSGQPTHDLDETNPMLLVRCELCGEKVRRGRVEEHERRVHRRAEKVARGRIDFDRCYDEETLCLVLRRSMGVRVSVERKVDWGLSAVPTMRVDGYWSDDHLDAYGRAFTSFCRWPEWKENARLEVYDSNPMVARSDAKRIVLFYRGDRRRLSVFVKFDNEALAHTRILDGVSLWELCGIANFGDALLRP